MSSDARKKGYIKLFNEVLTERINNCVSAPEEVIVLHDLALEYPHIAYASPLFALITITCREELGEQ